MTMSAQIPTPEVSTSPTELPTPLPEEQAKVLTQQQLQQQAQANEQQSVLLNKSVEQQQSLAQLIEASERLDEDLTYGVDMLRRRDKKEIIQALELNKKSIAKKLAELELITPEEEDDEQHVSELTKAQKILLWTAGSLVVLTTATGLFLTMYDISTGGIHGPSSKQFSDNLTTMFQPKASSKQQTAHDNDSDTEETEEEANHNDNADDDGDDNNDSNNDDDDGDDDSKQVHDTTRGTRMARKSPIKKPARLKQAHADIQDEDDTPNIEEEKKAERIKRRALHKRKKRRIQFMGTPAQRQAQTEEEVAEEEEREHKDPVDEEAKENGSDDSHGDAGAAGDSKRTARRDTNQAAARIEAKQARLARLVAEREALERDAQNREVIAEREAEQQAHLAAVHAQAAPRDNRRLVEPADSGDDTEPDLRPVPAQPGWFRRNVANSRPANWVKSWF